MRVGDVPAEWIELACEQAYGTPLEPGDDRRSIARAIAVIYPAIEAVVRAKVAEEIEAYADAAAKTGPMIPLAARKGILLAARVACREQP
ncbi:MAG: hypothetical protein JWO67_1063 [Streptosporangiaceae bacterium]|nr:hypothetical protein [Streptosporangiaceae bacterium]